MEMKECRYYQGCEAPICPLDEKTRDIAIFYKDEDICRNMEYEGERWRINQFRLRNNPKVSIDNYFTLAMLSKIQTISSKIKGINPDSNDMRAQERQIDRIAGQKARKTAIPHKAGIGLHTEGGQSLPNPFPTIEGNQIALLVKEV
jgi:hypothetical protein